MKKILLSEINSVNIIPDLTQEETYTGIQYGHLMVKPEALEHFRQDIETKKFFFNKLYEYINKFDLEVISAVENKFNHRVFEGIYKKEIDAGIIPEWEVSRFSESNTLSFIVKGIDARKKTILIKGKFCCDKSNCLYSSLRMNFLEKKTDCPSSSSDWGSGCGVRGFIARNKLASPDVGEKNYTVYNWIHAPDLDQPETIDIMINAINDLRVRL